MLKILGLMVTVLMMGLMVGAPNLALAQEWKTYINPEHKFTMQYPSLEVGDLISIDTNSSADVLVSEIGFRLIMMPDNGVKDMKPYIEKELQENLVSNHTIVQDIHPVTYFNLSGYEFTTYDGEDYLYTRIILHDGNEIYEIVDMDNKNDYSRDLFEQTINSIKFFD